MPYLLLTLAAPFWGKLRCRSRAGSGVDPILMTEARWR